MRVVELLAVVAFLAACVLIARATWRAARSEANDEWEPFHSFAGGRRRVYVRRGEELEPVGEIAPDDPDYNDAFLALMDQARERAAALNSERH